MPDPKPDETSLVEEVKKLSGNFTRFEQDYRVELKEVKDHIKSVADDGGLYDEGKLKTAISDILQKQQTDLEAKLALPGGGVRDTGGNKLVMPDYWKSGYSLEDPSNVDPVKMLRMDGMKGLDQIIQHHAMDDNTRHLQHMALDVWICDQMARLIAASRGTKYDGFKANFPKFSRQWGMAVKSYIDFYGGGKAAGDDAMDTTEHGDWVPTGFTPELRELIKIKLQVAGLFEMLTLTRSPWELPVNLTDTEGSYIAESTTVASNNPYDDTNVQTVSDYKVTFTAKKMRSRIVTSGEMVEDSIVPIIPFIRRQLVEILAQSLEIAILDGDATTAHFDSDITWGAPEIRSVWHGLRNYCLLGDDAAVFTTDVNADGDRELTIRGKMGEYGVNPNDLAYIVGINYYIQLLKKEHVETLEKYGPNATILSGELARIYGAPVIVSRHVREDLNASGVHDGTTEDNSYELCVNRRGFMLAEVRPITLESERLINTDQTNIVAMRRVDFQPVFGAVDAATSKKVAWYGYNIDNA